MFQKKTRSRSPLKEPPPHVSGQSLDEALRKASDEYMTEPVIVAAAMIGLALYEWGRVTFSLPPQPIAATVAAVLASGWATLKLVRGARQIRQLRQGRDGERIVAEVLDTIREEGFRVFHDIIGPNFNVDHLLVGPRGIYVIETKTIKKPHSPNATIWYDGETVSLAGLTPERDPIKQASALAKWIADLVQESSGKSYPVRPVVLYPGWYVERLKNLSPYVWVLNPKALPAFIQNEPVAVEDDEVAVIAFHLSRYVRAETDRGSRKGRMPHGHEVAQDRAA
jgi:hypothetical protein